MRFLAFVAAAVLVGGTVAVAPTASAEDQRPCVSKVEYQGGPDAIQIRGERTPLRRELEAEWDVPRLGQRDADLSGKYLIGYAYPACGYSFAEAQVWVIYSRGSHQATAMHRHVEPQATLHGHN